MHFIIFFLHFALTLDFRYAADCWQPTELRQLNTNTLVTDLARECPIEAVSVRQHKEKLVSGHTCCREICFIYCSLLAVFPRLEVT